MKICLVWHASKCQKPERSTNNTSTNLKNTAKNIKASRIKSRSGALMQSPGSENVFVPLRYVPAIEKYDKFMKSGMHTQYCSVSR